MKTHHVTESARPANLPPAPSALWDWMERSQLNQRAFAKLLKIPHVTMNHYLHGRRRPSLERLHAIYILTGIPAARWLEPSVGKPKKRAVAQAHKPQDLPSGNAHAR